MRAFIFAALLLPVLAFAVTPINTGNPVNVAAKNGGKNSEVCVTNAAGGTTITALAYRKGFALQNLGPNAIFCTVDGQAPLATGALGWKVSASGMWSLDIGPALTVKCIAATAAQVTPACTQVIEVR